jgi:hypothetical protein
MVEEDVRIVCGDDHVRCSGELLVELDADLLHPAGMRTDDGLSGLYLVQAGVGTDAQPEDLDGAFYEQLVHLRRRVHLADRDEAADRVDH